MRRAEKLLEVLREQGLEPATFPVAGEPELECVEQGVALAKERGSETVISFGGGSAIAY